MISPAGLIEPLAARWDRAVDVFGAFNTVQPKTLWESKLLVDGAPDWWDHATTGAGASGAWAATSDYALSVSASTAGSIVRQSVQRMPYQAGRAALQKITCSMGAAATGITREWGLADASNGIGFRQTSSGLEVWERNAGSETVVARADWSGGAANWLDETKTQIWVLQMAWLGVGPTAWGVMHDGVITWLHVRSHEGLLTHPYIATPVLPFRFKLANSGTGGSATLTAICCAHESLGGLEQIGQGRTADRGVTGVTATGQTMTPLVSIRLHSGTSRYAHIHPDAMSVRTTTTSEFRWVLVRNATTLTGATWASQVGPVDVDVAATAVSGGQESRSGYAAQSSDGTLTLPITDARWLGEFASTGASETMTLAVQRLSAAGSDTFYGALSWPEVI